MCSADTTRFRVRRGDVRNRAVNCSAVVRMKCTWDGEGHGDAWELPGTNVSLHKDWDTQTRALEIRVLFVTK